MTEPEKRRVSMRLREPAPKRLAVTTRTANIEKPTPVPVTKNLPKGSIRTVTKHKPPPSPPKEPTPPPLDPLELLPNKLVEGSLPSLDKPQGDLPDSKWQTIAESGVLLASINRSRQRWAHECIFEKYWSKSTYKKKKDPADVEKKDARPPMTKAGTCKIIVEPHIFDATIFVVRDQTPQPPTQMQVDRQFVQYGPTSTPTYSPQFVQPRPSSTSILHRPPQYTSPQVLPKTPHPTTPTTSNVTQTQSQFGNSASTSQLNKSTSAVPQTSVSKPTQPAALASPAATTTVQNKVTTPAVKLDTQPPTSTANSTTPSAKSTPTPATRIPPKPAAPLATSTTQRPVTTPSTATATSRPPTTTRPSTTSRPPAPSTSDPVIQMLAQRASTNPELKKIMKIVATGNASLAELTYFQGHIDELQKIVEERKAREAATAAQIKTSIPGPVQNKVLPLGGSTIHGTVAPRQPTYQTPNRVPLPPAGAIQNNIAQRPMYANTPPHMVQKPKPIAPPPLHVLIELGQNNVDRFLFPKYSILEQLSPQCMLVSFLIVKKPSQLAEADAAEAKKSRKKAEKLEQPVNGTEEQKTNEKSSPKNKKEEEKEVYQPITIRLESPSDGNLFSLISRVVAPVEQVQKHMRDIAERCEMAERRHLALRLPKESRDKEAKAH